MSTAPADADGGAAKGGGARTQHTHSVLSALDVLDCFEYDEELGVTEIARRLDVAKSTAHRLLTALCARGFAERVPATSRYRLGLHLYELGQLAQDRLAPRHFALPVLEQLRVATGQTVHLSTSRGADVVFIERLQTLRGIPLIGERHRRMPLHTTSAGKVLAAFNPEASQACESAGLTPMTERSIRSAGTWAKTLADIRRNGYAFSDSENRIGLASVAAPVIQANGQALYAVSVAGPSETIVPQRESLARLVTAAARKITQRLVVA
jgi:DNA-binding IclR family transcriptional regulator